MNLLMKLIVTLLLAGGLVMSVHAGGDAAADATVHILDYTFTPETVTIKVGGKVTWVNDEKRTSHSVWFKEPPADESERFFPGESWSRTFDEPGTYRYGCGPHPEMHGVIEVVP